MQSDRHIVGRVLALLGEHCEGHRQFRAAAKCCNIFQLCLVIDTGQVPGIFSLIPSNVWPHVAAFLWAPVSSCPSGGPAGTSFAIRVVSRDHVMAIQYYLNL